MRKLTFLTVMAIGLVFVVWNLGGEPLNDAVKPEVAQQENPITKQLEEHVVPEQEESTCQELPLTQIKTDVELPALPVFWGGGGCGDDCRHDGHCNTQTTAGCDPFQGFCVC